MTRPCSAGAPLATGLADAAPEGRPLRHGRPSSRQSGLRFADLLLLGRLITSECRVRVEAAVGYFRLNRARLDTPSLAASRGHRGGPPTHCVDVRLLQYLDQLGRTRRRQAKRAGCEAKTPRAEQSAFAGDRDISGAAHRNDAHVAHGANLQPDVVDVAPRDLIESSAPELAHP